MYNIKEILKNFFTSRLFVLGLIISLAFAGVIIRVFSIQIVNGENYQKNFTLKIEKDITIEATRGNIYDCNGELLAYNEISYSVVFSDNKSYNSTSEKNKDLNSELAEIIEMLLSNGETIYNQFGITLNADNTYSYNVSGSSLKTFLIDVFGESSFDDLGYNETFGFNEATATADQVMDYLMHDSSHFGINLDPTDDNPNPDTYDQTTAYYLTVVRYALLENRYSRYKTSVIAKNLSEKSIAYINEHSDSLDGAEIEEDTIRKYNYSEYFSSIIGYTGTISEEEYDELSQEDDSYTINDTIGRSGLEAYYEKYLRGQNGEQTVYVDNVGRISQVVSETEATAGNDVYLSIDAKLQQATYKLLEQEIAGVVYSNIKSGDIPIDDVYFALVNNNVIDISHFNSSDASSTEKSIYKSFKSRKKTVLSKIKKQLTSDNPTALKDMGDETLDDFTYIIKLLKNNELILSSQIDSSDKTVQKWKNNKISPQEYLKYLISNQWIDITLLDVDEKYADTNEVYDALVDYIINDLSDDTDFDKIVYDYMIHNEQISGRKLCLVLFDQEVLDVDKNAYKGLKNGSLSAKDFLLEKIDNIEITPAQLALDPCTGSCVITDVNTGAVKALVSYPGYDNNKMANGVDAEYYEKLQNDLSNPLYNYATQEKTACGSTFKMVTSTAGMAEGVLSPTTEITCTGIFDKVDNTPKCWIYPGSHHSINVSEALRDSCNVFFYTVGYNLSSKDYGSYDEKSGIKYIQKYASLYGLDQTSGLEIEENEPEIADEYPVMAAIGQSNNNYTTVSLSRYVTAVCSGKLYQYQLMSKIVDTDGNVIEEYSPDYTDISDTLTKNQWNAIYSGMRMVVQNLENFDNLKVEAAGKTGTAQQVSTRPNHALFVGYAPYDNPEISIASRIAYGYTSHNAAGFCSNVMSYYFKEQTLKEILAKKASGANTVTTSTNDFTD